MKQILPSATAMSPFAMNEEGDPSRAAVLVVGPYFLAWCRTLGCLESLKSWFAEP
jgi:hypothetical protein